MEISPRSGYGLHALTATPRPHADVPQDTATPRCNCRDAGTATPTPSPSQRMSRNTRSSISYRMACGLTSCRLRPVMYGGPASVCLDMYADSCSPSSDTTSAMTMAVHIPFATAISSPSIKAYPPTSSPRTRMALSRNHRRANHPGRRRKAQKLP